MQYIRYRFGEKSCWGRLEGDSVVELSAAPWMGDAQEVRRFIQEGEINLLPPCEPTKIICVGKNYYDHIKELHPGEDRPTEPLLFMKPTSALLPPEDVILMPPQSERVDYEEDPDMEVVVVLPGGAGRTMNAMNLEEAEALADGDIPMDAEGIAEALGQSGMSMDQLREAAEAAGIDVNALMQQMQNR